MRRSGIGELLEDQRLNAVLAWLLLGLVLVAVVESAVDRDPLWVGFAGSLAALALVPVVALRDPRAMLPWEVLALAALPVLGRAFATVPVTGRLATYLSVAAIALIVAVELHLFTPVRMTDGFAVLFVFVATMAAAGVWAVVRWLADIYLGTGFLASEQALMWEFVASTAAGVLAGAVFQGYVRRRTHLERRLGGVLP